MIAFADGMPVPRLRPAFEVDADLGLLEDHGITRVGHRRVIPIAGGAIRGEVEAEILPGGADWQVLRADGAVDVGARYSARTSDGAFLLIHSNGVRSGSPEVLEALLRGQVVDPSLYYFRTALTIEASDPALAHLQNTLFIAAAVREANRVSYVAYRVT